MCSSIPSGKSNKTLSQFILNNTIRISHLHKRNSLDDTHCTVAEITRSYEEFKL